MLKALIFDCDGVVVDSEPLIYEVAKKIFARYGVDLKLEDVHPGIGAGNRYMTEVVKKYGIKGVTVEELTRERAEKYLELAKTRLRPVAGFVDLIEEVKRRGLKTALASSSPNYWVESSLRSASVDPKLFDVIVNGDSIRRKKPFPDLFLRAAEELHVTPDESLVVEDAPMGIEASHGAGIRCIALVGSVPKGMLTGADFVIDGLREIPKLLGPLTTSGR
jgi:beta-phosphoglucomutase